MSNHDKKVNAGFLAANSGVASLIFTVILVGLGERIGERFLPVYLVATGATLFAPSILNALDNFLSAVYSFPGGWISSRFGYKKALLFFNIFAITGYLIVIIFPGWIPVIIGSVFFLSWSSLSMPAYMDLINKEIPKNKQVFGISAHSLIKRVPMALGPLLGGVLVDKLGITNGIRVAFSIATICSILGIIVQQTTLGKSKPAQAVNTTQVSNTAPTSNAVPASKPAPADNTASAEKSTSVPAGNAVAADKSTSAPVEKTSYKKQFSFSDISHILPWHFPKGMQIILVSDILAKFCSQIPYAYIAIWAMEYEKGAHLNATLFGTLTTIEMVCAILSYVLIGILGDKFKKKRFILTTFVLYFIFPIVLLCARSFSLLVVAFIIRGFKEFGEPTRKAQIMEMAPEGQKALYFGAFYFYRDIIVTVGVLLGGALWLIGPEVNLLVASGFGLASCLLYGILGK